MKLTAEYFPLSPDVSVHRQQSGSHSAETLVQISLQQDTPASVNTNKLLLIRETIVFIGMVFIWHLTYIPFLQLSFDIPMIMTHTL